MTIESGLWVVIATGYIAIIIWAVMHNKKIKKQAKK